MTCLLHDGVKKASLTSRHCHHMTRLEASEKPTKNLNTKFISDCIGAGVVFEDSQKQSVPLRETFPFRFISSVSVDT